MEKVWELKRQMEESGTQGLALDIDETIADTAKTWTEEMIRLFGNPDGLSVAQLIETYSYVENVPWWQTEAAMNWIERARIDGTLLETIPVIPGADITVQIIHDQIIPITLYPTVRSTDLALSTKRWLRHNKFPEAPMLFRPSGINHGMGAKWKAEALSLLHPQIQGVIDDNVDLVRALPEGYPGTIFLYGNTKSPRDDIKVIPCPTWSCVVENTRTVFAMI